MQQATLRELRAAIAPEIQRQKPLIELPDRFRDFGDGNKDGNSMGEIDGGTVVEVRFSDAEDRGGEDTRRKEEERHELKRDVDERGNDGDAGEEGEKQLSRAERRKKIKEEILLAGEGEGYKGYKRRMW